MGSVFYIDTFLLNNFIINYTLIFFSLKTSKLEINRLRIIIVSILAAIISLPLMFSYRYIFILFKITAPLLMCYYSVDKISLKQTIKLVAVFWIYALILSGIFAAINLPGNLFTVKDAKYGTVAYAEICLAIFILYLLCKYILKFLSRQFLIKDAYKAVKISYNNKSITLIGFYDSGNNLVDKKTNLPVFIVSKRCLKDFFNLQTSPTDYIQCTTVLGTGVMPVIKPDSITVDGIIANAIIGISDQDFYSDYDIILSRAQIERNTISFKETENIYV
ncbi:MAG: sigma-E processing peptidase SpoIIGA [Clostridia bacterium]|nr:sigma-E processing peptidase SpoIIGA [Clostridia bacterium]